MELALTISIVILCFFIIAVALVKVFILEDDIVDEALGEEQQDDRG